MTTAEGTPAMNTPTEVTTTATLTPAQAAALIAELAIHIGSGMTSIPLGITVRDGNRGYINTHSPYAFSGETFTVEIH